MADKYVQNVHTNGIRIDVKDRNFSKRFPVQAWGMDGRVTETGFTRVTEEELEVCKGDRLFQYFLGKGKLVVHDTLPPEAMTAHDALVSAKKEAGAMQRELETVKAEKEELAVKLAEMEAKYAELAQASSAPPEQGVSGKAKKDA